MPDLDSIVISPPLHERFVTTVRSTYPRKSFGYLISDIDQRTPTDFMLFEANIRNDPDWKGEFEAYGRYFVDHSDAGFVATPEESWRRQKEIWGRGMFEVGVFHSHQRHPANFSLIDYEMHQARFPNLWHLIISMRNPDLPQLRVFSTPEGRVREVPIQVVPEPVLDAQTGTPLVSSDKTAAVSLAKDVLQLDRTGRPCCTDARIVVAAVEALERTGDDGMIDELLVNGFLRGRDERYECHIRPQMRLIEGGAFAMGTDEHELGHFCGESPRHTVELSPFRISSVPVTNDLFSVLRRERGDLPRSERAKPVVNVSWYEAALFAIWSGCRLPTEAEWERSCGAGHPGEWCCEDESELQRYGWYSENSHDELHPVATREPNAFGLFDFHGNVWEWCHDRYDQDYYRRSPGRDPMNAGGGELRTGSAARAHRVTRGGSMLSLAEMCRTRYRFHESSDFVAPDLGFRLAQSAPAQRRGGVAGWRS